MSVVDNVVERFGRKPSKPAQPLRDDEVGQIPAHLRREPTMEQDLAANVRSRAVSVVPPEVASRDKHFRAADAIENDAKVLHDHAVTIRQQLDEGLAQVEAAMAAAFKKAEDRCAIARDELIRASDAHTAAVADYLRLCQQRADEFRATGENVLVHVKKADDRIAAKRDAILNAGEGEPRPAELPQAEPQPDKASATRGTE